jgi:hypothetical protein
MLFDVWVWVFSLLAVCTTMQRSNSAKGRTGVLFLALLLFMGGPE